MPDFRSTKRYVLAFVLCATTAPLAFAQSRPAPVPAAAPVAIPTADELADLQDQLASLVRMSPTLMQVVLRDPSLLADQEYVSRSNPQLAQFLAQHPEIARNPDFYLFSNAGSKRDRRVEALRRPGESHQNATLTDVELRRQLIVNTSVLISFVGGVAALLWLIRLLLENRRWSRAFRQQQEIHSKLIDRFSSNQELFEYMNSEAGRRFLEAAPIPVGINGSHSLPGGWARVIGPLQFGIVLTMLGFGLLILEHSLSDYAAPFLFAAMVVLMPGLGFIISAIVTWRLSARLGLMPAPATDNRQ